MAGEKYIVAAAENPVQISVRNILNPAGYSHLANCSDAISLIRLVRSYHPDFIVVDIGIRMSELRSTLETIDDEMLCACVLIGEYRDAVVSAMLEGSRALSFCPKPLNRDFLLQTVEMANLSYKRLFEMKQKLSEMTENFETKKAVDRAKWILMERDGISEQDAYDRMRKKSMNNRMSMKSIAEAIIFTYELNFKEK